MELFPPNSKIRFMALRGWSVWVSVVLMVLSIISIATKGFNLALDFSGGTLVEVVFDKDTEAATIREALEKGGFENAVVQAYSIREYAIRVRNLEGEQADASTASATGETRTVQTVGDKVGAAIKAAGLIATIKKSEFVGAQMGRELLEDALLAMLLVGVGILLYVALRFEWKFAVAALACSIHDVVIILGFFSITGIEFELTVLAAILALIGHSLNDTIVVFDRVREMFRTARKMDTIELFDKAINNTLSRTIMTSVSTLFAVAAMYFFGGPVLHGFSICLIVGIFLGTASSILFACPVLLLLGANKRDLMKAEQDPRLAAMP